MNLRLILAALALLFAAPAIAAPGIVKVALKTSEGTIVIGVDTRRAPVTAKNFLAYVDKKKFVATSFYRAASAKGYPGIGLVQGGIRKQIRLALPPIAHEPTSRTGLRHVDGAVSMARDAPGSAMGDFFIVAGVQKSMDASASDPGYAVFGKVVSGMQVVKRILKARTFAGGAGAMKGQLIEKPIRIIEAKRLS